MKIFISVLFSIISCIGLYAQTLNDSLKQAAAIVDGLFFDKSVPTKSLTPGNSTIAVLKDPDGAMVIAVYLPEGFVLEESMKAKAIPAGSVKYSDKLLNDYNGRKPQTVAVYGGIGVKVGEPFVNFEYSDIDNNIWNNEKLKNIIFGNPNVDHADKKCPYSPNGKKDSRMWFFFQPLAITKKKSFRLQHNIILRGRIFRNHRI